MKVNIFVHPNSKNPRIQKDLMGELHVYVKEPPLENKANKAVAEALAGYFKIGKSKVVLIRGGKSKLKVFEIK